MGTFHQDRHELHGITVVVDTDGDEVFIGRCDDMDDERVILLDADVHREGEGEPSKEAWIEKSSEYGVWAKHRRLVIPLERVTSVRRLGEVGGP